MFQLIVAVVAVALVVVLAVAILYFGGTAFQSGSDKALYAQLMNNGNQIEGALNLYQADTGVKANGSSSEVFDKLTSVNAVTGQTYLKDVPNGSWSIDGGVIYRELSDIDQCRRINVVAGKDMSTVPSAYNGCPPCDDTTNFTDFPGCRKTS